MMIRKILDGKTYQHIQIVRLKRHFGKLDDFDKMYFWSIN